MITLKPFLTWITSHVRWMSSKCVSVTFCGYAVTFSLKKNRRTAKPRKGKCCNHWVLMLLHAYWGLCTLWGPLIIYPISLTTCNPLHPTLTFIHLVIRWEASVPVAACSCSERIVALYTVSLSAQWTEDETQCVELTPFSIDMYSVCALN